MSLFGRAIDDARNGEPTRQARELEKHLRTHGLAEVSTMSGMLTLKKVYSRLSADEFEQIVERVRRLKNKKSRSAYAE